MKFTPQDIGMAIHMSPQPVTRIVLPEHLATKLFADLRAAPTTDVFRTFFDPFADQVVNKALLGYLWGRDVFTDFYLPMNCISLEGPNGYINQLTVDIQ